jgi:hypothetical protein
MLKRMSLNRSEGTLPLACKSLAIPVFFAQLIPLLIAARYRLIDGDEGFYLMASRSVFEGKIPYRDFFFTQMPLVPYLYGLWLQITGRSWISARVFSATLAALLGAAIFAFVCAETRRWASGLIAAFLFVSSTLVLGWFTIVKTFPLSGIFLMSAFLLSRPSAPALALAIGGFSLGLAADVRSYLAGLIPLFLWWILRDPIREFRLKTSLYFLLGFAVAVLPNLYFVILDPAAYFFGNLGFHSIRSDSGMIGNIPQKLYVLAQLCFTGGPGNGLQMTMLIIFIVWLTAHAGIGNAGSRRAIQLAAALGVISLLPTPSYIQYFCLCLPFMIVAAVCRASQLLDRIESVPTRRWAAAGGVVLSLLFAAASTGDYRRFTRTGEGLNGIRGLERAQNWNIDNVRAVSHAIDELTVPGECVVSLWPGYIFESAASPFPGLENNTGRDRVDALKPGDAARYHIVSKDRIGNEIAHHNSRIIVIGNQESMFVEAGPYNEMLIRAGYTVVRKIGDTSIWQAPR